MSVPESSQLVELRRGPCSHAARLARAGWLRPTTGAEGFVACTRWTGSEWYSIDAEWLHVVGVRTTTVATRLAVEVSVVYRHEGGQQRDAPLHCGTMRMQLTDANAATLLALLPELDRRVRAQTAALFSYSTLDLAELRALVPVRLCFEGDELFGIIPRAAVDECIVARGTRFGARLINLARAASSGRAAPTERAERAARGLFSLADLYRPPVFAVQRRRRDLLVDTALFPAQPECVVCLEKPALVVSGGCGHAAICPDCSATLGDEACPVCRSGARRDRERRLHLASRSVLRFCIHCRHPVGLRPARLCLAVDCSRRSTMCDACHAAQGKRGERCAGEGCDADLVRVFHQ